MKKLFCLGVVALVVCNFATFAFAEPSSAIRSLTGMTAVRVLVEDFNAAMQETGLHKEQLYALAREALAKYEIRVLTPEEGGRVPFLYIRLSSAMSGGGDESPVALYLNVQVRQMAVLEKDPGAVKSMVALTDEKPIRVSTWENGTMAIVARKEIGFYVRIILTNLVGDFAHDYKEANGGQPQS